MEGSTVQDKKFEVGPPSGNWQSLLLNKIVFVTGAGGAIGSSIAHTCALHGAKVVVADVNKQTADEVVKTILTDKALVQGDANNENTERVISVELDVADDTSVKNSVNAILTKWKTIDILVNNAAIFTLGEIENISAEDWTKVFNINVRGYALMAKYVVPIMKKQKSGCIINMASHSSLIAQPAFVPYSTTKGAILQMTRNLALDLGPFNIRVLSICPGTICKI
ncbi:unnamed protein product [Didymodactylos carnosus]|uniref:Uncharacterized protein n=1 Tax=Didymodactylos carnosus TaxID=1234261 RepID=A0A816CPD3_9BILA|nr:unnamed protein product [Didymodactylos carnosus]CAF1623786.1 unnamed protein product [Didymodactylos carnosus]CAF4382852.1 unnamed protein product [Didymodactylos carnosus]CAF4516157.1 unnamed protein product [Didymodactylos carnosus]